MEEQQSAILPSRCPVCRSDLVVTKLECISCGTEVTGTFGLGHLASLQEPYATLLEMFLRARGNVKEMERELGLSYPTVRARLEEAFEAAGFSRAGDRTTSNDAPWVDPDIEERIRARVDQRMAEVEQRLSAMGQRGRAFAERERAARRADVLTRLEQGEITADEAARLLRELKDRR
ncbi:MAG TPA: DUF2089 family protein [Chloroflexota bacterium]